MTREYQILTSLGGTDLQITGEDMAEEHHKLHGATDQTRLRQAEQIINERFYRLEPFPGFHWQRVKDGWRTTDHDLKAT